MTERPSVAASRVDRVQLAGEAEAGVGDVELEMLGHLVLVEHGADLERDRCGATQRIARARDGGLDAGKLALGGLEEFAALAAALGREVGVAADDQALAGEVGRR